MTQLHYCQRQYEFVLRTAKADAQYYLQGHYQAHWAIREGQTATLTMDLPTAECNIMGFLTTDFGEDFRIEIWRRTAGTRALVGEQPFFVNFIAARQGADGKRTIYIEAEGSLGLLARHINPYQQDDPRSALILRRCDDQMKFVVRNNFTAIAGSYVTDPDPIRSLATYMTVQADSSSVTAQYQGRVQNQDILSILSKIQDFSFSKGEPLFYHLVQTATFGNPFLQFRTYVGQRGVNRTITTGGVNARTITPDNGTISEYELGFNWKNTATRMYGGGRGVGSARSYIKADDPTLPTRLTKDPFALREKFANIGSTDTIDIQTEVEAELQSNLSNIQLSGSLGETPVFVYGVDWALGDRITAFVENYSIEVYIDSEECTLENGQEQITVGFSNNLLKRLTGLGEIAQRLRTTENSIRRLRAADYA